MMEVSSLHYIWASSKLERICAHALHEVRNRCLVQTMLLNGVRNAFMGCECLCHVSSNLERICADAFSRTCSESLSVPDNVVIVRSTG